MKFITFYWYWKFAKPHPQSTSYSMLWDMISVAMRPLWAQPCFNLQRQDTQRRAVTRTSKRLDCNLGSRGNKDMCQRLTILEDSQKLLINITNASWSRVIRSELAFIWHLPMRSVKNHRRPVICTRAVQIISSPIPARRLADGSLSFLVLFSFPLPRPFFPLSFSCG